MKTTAFLCTLLLTSNLLMGQVTQGLVGHFPFTSGSFTDEANIMNASISTTLGDRTYQLASDRFGNQDCAINFQGAVMVAGSHHRNVTQEVSVSLWVNTTDTPDGYRFLLSKYGLNAQDVPLAGYSMLFFDSIRFDARDEDWRHNQYMTSNYSQTQISDGEWHHLVGICKNDTATGEVNVELWIDGQKEGGNTFGWQVSQLNNSRRTLCFAGSDNYTATPTFKGILDDIMIFNRGLDSAEISMLFNAPDPLVKPHVVISADDSLACVGVFTPFYADTADADSILWDFGDGTTSIQQNPEHAYAVEGHYQVTARVKNQSSGLFFTDTLEGGLRVFPIYSDTVDASVSENQLPYQFGSQSLNDSGTFQEIFESTHGCDSAVTLHLTVLSSVGISSLAHGGWIGVHPNPTSGIVEVQLPEYPYGMWKIVIADASGKLVYRCSAPSGKHSIDLSPYGRGMYLLRIQTNELLTSRILFVR